MPSRTRRKRWQGVDKSNVRLDSVIQLYLMYQEDKNHSPKTVRWYSDLLRRFSEYLRRDAMIKDITPDAIKCYSPLTGRMTHSPRRTKDGRHQSVWGPVVPRLQARQEVPRRTARRPRLDGHRPGSGRDALGGAAPERRAHDPDDRICRRQPSAQALQCRAGAQAWPSAQGAAA